MYVMVRRVRGRDRYRMFGGCSALLNQPHQQHFWSLGGPVLVELLFGLGAEDIVWRLQGAKQLGERRLDVCRKE